MPPLTILIGRGIEFAFSTIVSAMESREDFKYQSLRKIITAPSDPAQAEIFMREALKSAIHALGIAAASIVITTKDGTAIINVREGDASFLKALGSLEGRMLASLRSDFGLENIYSTLNQDGQKSLFSYLIKTGDTQMGTVSGICEGSRNIALEEEFIEVVAASLRYLFGQAGMIDSARIDAVKQTTITLNHEINNPLTVVLGNVQLLLMQGEKLPEEVRNRLQLIEQSSLRIRDAVSRLLKLNEAKSTTYVDDTKMIDLQDSEESGK